MVTCYYCGERAQDAMRGRVCPRCGKRLPGTAALMALGAEPKKDSLGGLVVWAWAFLVIGVASVFTQGMLSRGGNPVQVSAALQTFHYTALTCRFTCAMIGLTLAGANIGTSRLHGGIVLAALIGAHWLPL